MPNIKSAEKRVLVIKKKTLENQMLKSSLKTALKKFDAALAENDVEKITEAHRYAVKKLDQAVAKGVIHKNTASRKKSNLALKVAKLAS